MDQENNESCKCECENQESIKDLLRSIAGCVNRIAYCLERQKPIEAKSLEASFGTISSGAAIDDVTLKLLKGWMKGKMLQYTKGISKKVTKVDESLKTLRQIIGEGEDGEISNTMLLAMIGVMGKATSEIFTEISRKVGSKEDLGQKFNTLTGSTLEELGLAHADEDEESSHQ